jgi:hypothetical protein
VSFFPWREGGLVVLKSYSATAENARCNLTLRLPTTSAPIHSWSDADQADSPPYWPLVINRSLLVGEQLKSLLLNHLLIGQSCIDGLCINSLWVYFYRFGNSGHIVWLNMNYE